MKAIRKADPKKRKAEMYALIEQWRTGNRSQRAVSEDAGISFHVFKYWLKKQRNEQAVLREQAVDNASENKNGTFLPVTVEPVTDFGKLQIVYPNGVAINCSQAITTKQIKELIKLF
jgi:hypothetical protein